MSLRDLQRRVDAYMEPFEEGYWHPLANLARLTEEVGELAREVNDRFGQKPKRPDEDPGSMALELADILFVVICLANQTGVDLDEAFQATLRKYRERDAGRWAVKPGADLSAGLSPDGAPGGGAPDARPREEERR